ncbi:DUF922 domain-containing protein, partial [Xanthovirga aplysinae]|uniref:DUF922 domain-containing protein n=1 Tax=Xanthovirga aplysinae TaxID=2529853 RepID=UPI0012BC69FE
PKKKDIIHWNPDRKLQWKDFKGAPDPKSEFSALTNAVLNYKYRAGILEDKIDLSFEVSCYFEKRFSWVKKGHEKPELLAHEQLHFDITELYARILRKRLEQGEYTPSNYKRKCKGIFQQVMKEWKKMQDQYDKETNHGSKKIDQEKWMKKVKQEMLEKQKYASSK